MNRVIPARALLSGAVLWSVLLAPFWAMAADWTVIAKDSKIGFRGTQTGTAFDGVFPKFDARIRFDPQQLETARVVVTIDLTQAESGSKERDSALRQPDWFHVEKYPVARFETTEIHKIATDRYEAAGFLTLKGVRRPVTLPFDLKISGKTAVMNGQLTLNRHDFKVGEGQWVSDQWVGKDVTVTVRIAAHSP